MARTVRRGYAHPFRAGLIAIVAIALLTIFGFTKDNPFKRDFHLSAVVADSAGVKPGSLVRVAGVNVGQVRSVERYDGGRAAKINMDIRSEGLPVHEDARVLVRPRLFLEGNFVLELQPGAPGGKRLEDGDTIPITRTARAVQLDQLFSTFQGPERKDLQVVFRELGQALGQANPDDTDPLTKGETGGEAFNDVVKAFAASGTDIEELFRALQGQERGDLAAAIRAFADTSTPLADRSEDLGRLIENLDRVVSVFAANQGAVRAGVQKFAPTMELARSELPPLRRSLDPTAAVARNLARAMPRLPALVAASGPFLTQTDRLLSAQEGGELVKTLEPITSGLARTVPSLTTTLEDLDRIAICTTDVLAPTANQVIQDGPMTTGLTAWDEFLRGMVGLAGAGQNFDANGAYARAATAQGQLFVTGQRERLTNNRPNTYFGTANSAPVATRPAKPAKSRSKMSSTTAPWRFDQACSARFLPNLSAVPSGPADGTVK